MKNRCSWVLNDKTYIKYHDQEWGVPVYDDDTLFTFLILETFQAGLSWITILKKRENFNKAFDNFNYKKISSYSQGKYEKLLNDSSIIRNKLKIKATITNAIAFIEIQKKYESFSNYYWKFVDQKSIQNNFKTQNEVPTTSELANKISKDLKKKGFKFVGPTIIYAFMQATGMVNDHTTNCFRYKEVQNL
ncbi:MAG TPA: DNA-3-methyladenine glycosylase I [Tenacibaculum sp.]|nr:DNA-3-methyladenine glycosylase I [Tenacibaculum sp.]